MGGAIGSIRTSHEINAGPNAGLKKALDKYLAPIKESCPTISWADLIQMASAVAIEKSGGQKIPMTYGRIDGERARQRQLHLVFRMRSHPSAGRMRATRQAYVYVFYKYGMDDRDIVALSGAHTLGRAFKDRSGTVEEGYSGSDCTRAARSWPTLRRREAGRGLNRG